MSPANFWMTLRIIFVSYSINNMVRSNLVFWCLLITLGFSDLHATTTGVKMPDSEFATIDNSLPFENAKLLRIPGPIAYPLVVKPAKERNPYIAKYTGSCFSSVNINARINVPLRDHLIKRSSWKLYLLFHNLRYYDTETHINIL